MVSTGRRTYRGLLLVMLALLALGAALPQQAAAQEPSLYVTVNPDGGQAEDDGLRISVGDGRYQVERNGKFQVYNEGAEFGTMQWILVLDWQAQTVDAAAVPAGTMCVSSANENGEWRCVVPDDDSWAVGQQQSWDHVSINSVVNGDTTDVTMVISEEWSQVGDLSCPFTLSTGLSYTAPDYFADVSAQLEFDPSASDQCPTFSAAHLYLVADMYLDGSDEGPSRVTEYEGARVVAQFNETAIGGFREVGTTWDSYAAASFPCVYGATADVALDDEYLCLDDNFASGSARGIYYAEPLPDSVDANDATDAGVAVHFDLFANGPAAVETQIFFAPASLIPSDTAPPECELTPDMAVSPQFINLAPGGTATVEIAMRNLCNDAPYRNSDLLVSFSDGLTVTDGSAGMVNLGQRAAWQGFTLAPAETRKWTVTVKAGETLAVAPVHISELYHLGRVASRIDGVFITPAPAPVVETPAAPAPAPVVEAPALLPETLPNTARTDAAVPLLMLVGVALCALLFGRRLIRR
jgi:hypothetical protein